MTMILFLIYGEPNCFSRLNSRFNKGCNGSRIAIFGLICCLSYNGTSGNFSLARRDLMYGINEKQDLETLRREGFSEPVIARLYQLRRAYGKSEKDQAAL